MFAVTPKPSWRCDLVSSPVTSEDDAPIRPVIEHLLDDAARRRRRWYDTRNGGAAAAGVAPTIAASPVRPRRQGLLHQRSQLLSVEEVVIALEHHGALGGVDLRGEGMNGTNRDASVGESKPEQ